MSTATKSIERNKHLPAHLVSIEIYSGIARFPVTARFLVSVCHGALRPMKRDFRTGCEHWEY